MTIISSAATATKFHPTIAPHGERYTSSSAWLHALHAKWPSARTVRSAFHGSVARGSLARRSPRHSAYKHSATSSCGSATSCADLDLTASLLCSYTACSEILGYLKRIWLLFF